MKKETTKISSQEFLSDEIVFAKMAAKDYDVTLSPVLEIDGESYQVVLDGHHSLAAAQADGIEPVYHVATIDEHDAIALLNDDDIDGFLDAVHMGDDYYDVITGRAVWA